MLSLEESQLGRSWQFFSLCFSITKSHLTLCTPRIVACQASLSFTISWSLLKHMSIELMIPSNHLILCHPLLFLPSIFPSIRVFSNESCICIRWPKYWSFSFNISSSLLSVIRVVSSEYLRLLIISAGNLDSSL